MSDPTTASPVVTVALFSAAAALAGPLFGPIMLVVITSAVGAYVAAAEAQTATTREVLIFVLRGALFAVVLSAIASEWVEARFGMAGHSALAAASAFIGYYAHRLRRIDPFGIWRLLRTNAAGKGTDRDPE